ncbi:thioesterase [Azospirillum sp. RWY-5-1]|uniref:Thioesterase n=1 Tax=Azospirillum oleiclasticum TaxID=2735135 RepID=A0ABX2TKY6_9PROT|nr:alpha/beta fold hydrolase [Azospirillum oleiclasticum]NYZ14607.1 thioesterase [Azospirillum oleiclasticum]NYZ24385.1 thioesterase [Azospirillum oleiclasticum]
MTVFSSPLARRWFRRYGVATAPAGRLLCFPPAGAAAGFYRRWGSFAPPGLEILAVQYPGREDRIAEPLCDGMAALADGIAGAAATLTDLPLALFGHSMGAAVAFEVARRLEGAGVRVEHLFVSGRPPPHRQRPKTIHRQDDDGIIAEVVRLGGTARAVLENEDLRAFVIPQIRNDFRLSETYEGRIAPPVRAPLSVFIGDADSEVSADEAADWAAGTTGTFTLASYAGGHFYLNDHTARLVRDLAARLPRHAPWLCTP